MARKPCRHPLQSLSGPTVRISEISVDSAEDIREMDGPPFLDRPVQSIVDYVQEAEGPPLLASSAKSVGAESKDGREPGFAGCRRSSIHPTDSAELGIYWHTPVVMILGLVLGMLFASGLHLFYRSLHGKPVGGPQEQEYSLRLGTTLAFLSTICLTYSMTKSYTQCLFRDLRSHTLSLRGLDAAFAAMNDLLSFLNGEMWMMAKLASSLALLTW